MKITEKNKNKNHGLSKRLIGGIVIVFLLVIALSTYRDSLQDILKGILEVSFKDIMTSALLAAFFFMLEGTIIYIMAAAVAPTYRIKDGIAVAYRCEFYRLITFGSGAGIAEIHYLHKKGMEPAVGAGISILQFVMKKIGVAVLGIIGFMLLCRFPNTRALRRDYAVFLAVGCIVTASIVFFLLSVTLSNNVMNFVIWMIDKAFIKFPTFAKKADSLKAQVCILNESGHIFLRRKHTLLQIVLCDLIKLILIYCIPAYMLQGKSDVGFVECAALMAVVYMLAGVIPTPSGIGSLEFVYLLFFGTLANPADTVPALLVFRFATWILPFMIGGILCFISYCRSLR